MSRNDSDFLFTLTMFFSPSYMECRYRRRLDCILSWLQYYLYSLLLDQISNKFIRYTIDLGLVYFHHVSIGTSPFYLPIVYLGSGSIPELAYILVSLALRSVVRLRCRDSMFTIPFILTIDVDLIFLVILLRIIPLSISISVLIVVSHHTTTVS